MTAAYMTRCVYLTFFGEYRGHGHPHESPPSITVPAVDPRRRSRSSPAWLNLAVGDRSFADWTATTALRALVEPIRLEHPFIARGAPRISVARSPSRGIARRPALYYFRDASARTASPSAARLAARRLHAPRQQVLPRPPLHRQRRRRHQGPDRPGRLLVQPERHRRRRQRRRHRRARRVGRFTYDVIDQKVVDGLVNGAGVGAEEGGQHPAHHPDRPGAAVRRRPLRRRRSSSPSPSSSSSQRREHAMNSFDHWALEPRGVPARWSARLVDDAHAREPRRPRIKVDRPAHDAGHRRRRRLPARRTSTTTHSRHAAVRGQQALDRRHQQPLPHRHRRHLAAAARSCRC